MKYLSDIGINKAPENGDLDVDGDIYSNGKNIVDMFYPVGSIYTATVSTNPATLLGFGTWTAYGEGRVIVGKASSGTFATAGATGGAETVTLTSAQSGIPAHGHATNYAATAGGSGNGLVYGTKTGASTGTLVDNHAGANAASSHNNLQPYIVAYMWQRVS